MELAAIGGSTIRSLNNKLLLLLGEAPIWEARLGPSSLQKQQIGNSRLVIGGRFEFLQLSFIIVKLQAVPSKSASSSSTSSF